MSGSASHDIYQLRVVLRGVSPLIWRRLLVASNSTVAELHHILQIAFGWSDEHLHRFYVHGRDYDECRQGDSVRLQDLRLKLREKFLYQYNFTAGWEWDIRIEAILARDSRGTYPACTGGRQAMPPEECSGPWAYMERLDQRYTNPPREEMCMIADVLEPLLEADPATLAQELELAREKLKNVPELQDALEALQAWNRFRPGHFDRRQINVRLRAWAHEGGLSAAHSAGHDLGKGRAGDPA